MRMKEDYKGIDKGLIAVTLVIFLFGLLVLYSATQAKGMPLTKSYLFRQVTWAVIGMVFLAGVIAISYQKFIDMAYLVYGANVFLLMLVLVIGGERMGAQRWFTIGAFTFQPSEFIKLSLILALSAYVGSQRESMKTIRSLLTASLILGIPFILVLLQPDLGTALLLLPIFFIILLAGGADIRHLAVMIGCGTAALPFMWHFLHGYQKQRLMVFMDPDIDPLGAGYTIIQSKIAIGSGGLLGKGWLSGTQNQLNFLPERHTDFIFSVIGEEWGFLGAVILVALYFLIANRAFNIAALANDVYGKLVASGIAVMLSLQIIINIGMTIGIMPVVGIPLPLVSYGGSSMITTFIAIGLLLNVELRRSRF
ncbi:MAG: rod shape-determining protein RodA [Candidatus Omnitrophota bacterium]